MGASETLLPLVQEYTEIIYLGAFIIVLHPMLDIFAINDKQPLLAMIAMIVGAAMNIVLNYLFLFVLELGIHSSALATVLGMGLECVFCCSIFCVKKAICIN